MVLSFGACGVFRIYVLCWVSMVLFCFVLLCLVLSSVDLLIGLFGLCLLMILRALVLCCGLCGLALIVVVFVNLVRVISVLGLV